MEKNRTIALFSLFGVTLLWGGTFIWMQQSLDAASNLIPTLSENHVAIFFVMMRFVIAGFFLLLLVPKTWVGLGNIDVWKGGLLLGVIVWGGFILQMLGLTEVTPAVSAFLTSLYVVFTALIGVFTGMQKLTRFAILGVILATFGAGWISGPPQLNFGLGEWLTVACALLFGAHIIATDKVTKIVDPIQVTATMLITVAVLSIIVFLLSSRQHFNDFTILMKNFDFVFPLLLCAILGSLVALLVLNIFQKQVSPVRAAILYALEPVWAMTASLFLGLEGNITFWLPLGAIALLIGNLIVELDQKPTQSQKSEE